MGSRGNNAMVVTKKFRQKKYQLEIEKALPEPRIVTRFLRLAADALAKNPKLAACSEESLRTAIMEAAHLGVVLDGTLGHGSILPFKGEAKFALGYKGYIELGLRSGRVNHVETAVVREHDDFAYQLGTDAWLRHIPKAPMGARGERIGAWCMVVYPNGLKSFDYMQRAEIEAIRLKSPSGRSEWSAWQNHPGEMWRKTVLIRHMKTRGISPEITRSASLEEAYEAGLGRTQKEVEAEVVERKAFEEKMDNGQSIAPVESKSAPVSEQPKSEAPQTGGPTPEERDSLIAEHLILSGKLKRKRIPNATLTDMSDNTLTDAVERLRQQVAETQKGPEGQGGADSEPSPFVG